MGAEFPGVAGEVYRSWRVLRRLAPGERVAALVAGLEVCGGGEARGLAGEVLGALAEMGAGGERELAAVAGVWGELGEGERRVLVALAEGKWGGIAARLVRERRAERRLALVGIAAHIDEPGVIGGLAELIGDAEPRVAEAAGERLLELCRREAIGEEVEAAVARAFETFAVHRRPAAAMALLEVAGRLGGVRSGGEVARVVGDHELTGHGAVRRMIRRGGAVGAAQVWLLLKHPVWAGACVERLGAAEGEDLRELQRAMLERVHLLSHPGRRKQVLRARGELSRGRGARVFALSLDPGERVDLVAAGARLVAGSGARTGEFDRWAAGLLMHPAAAVRAAVGRVAAGMVGRPAVLLDLCFDADERVARSALLALRPWRRVGYLPDAEVDRTVRAAARSAHGSVRRLAAEVRVGPEGWLAGDARARVSARAAMNEDREGVVRQIRARILSGGGESGAAVRLAAGLGLVEELEGELIGMLRGGSTARGRAMAAGALGHSRSAEAGAALAEAVEGDADARVRANAMEALERRARIWGTGEDRMVRELAAAHRGSAEQRVRGNSLRAALVASGGEDPEAVAGVGAMLADARAEHRLTGVWVVERAAPGTARNGWGEIAARVAEMAVSDPDARVRARAERCARVVMARMRSAWTVRVRGVESVGVGV